MTGASSTFLQIGLASSLAGQSQALELGLNMDFHYFSVDEDMILIAAMILVGIVLFAVQQRLPSADTWLEIWRQITSPF